MVFEAVADLLVVDDALVDAGGVDDPFRSLGPLDPEDLLQPLLLHRVGHFR